MHRNLVPETHNREKFNVGQSGAAILTSAPTPRTVHSSPVTLPIVHEESLDFVREADLRSSSAALPNKTKQKKKAAAFRHERLLFAAVAAVAAAFFLCRRSRRLRPSVSPACAAFGFPFFVSPNAVPSSSSSVCEKCGNIAGRKGGMSGSTSNVTRKRTGGCGVGTNNYLE